MSESSREFSSFRDPSGAVFQRDGVLYRQINECYRAQYEALMKNGLYDALVKNGTLISHAEVPQAPMTAEGFCVIRPERVPMISYPYEWSFSMLQDAALTTLRAHRAALDRGMILKDASAYNIQFLRGQAVLIDTLSFDFAVEGKPWIAYGQFCRHFLAPLALMAYTDIRLNQLLKNWIDGIPIDLAAKLLGKQGGLFCKQHIVWHARAVQKHDEDGKRTAPAKELKLPLSAQIAMIESMMRGIERMALPKQQTEWGAYYSSTNYSETAANAKQTLVREYLAQAKPESVWDIGANDGRFSRLALELGAHVVALDIDPLAVESGYRWVRREKQTLLPLVCDLTNPSPAIGFANRERGTLFSRQKPDCILALALIHHLAISNNLPLAMIAGWLSERTQSLVIEFVPKTDSQVQVLLATRDDIFPDYTEEGFEAAFSTYFEIARKDRVADSERTMYLLRSKH